MPLLVIPPLQAFGPFTITFSPADFTFHKDGNYDRFLAPCYDLTSGKPGTPELPVKYLTYIIPPEMLVDSVKIAQTNMTDYPGFYNIYPTQQKWVVGSAPSFVSPDPNIYSAEEYYPGEVIKITNQGVKSGARLVTLAVHPFQYQGSSQKLRLLQEATLEFFLSYSGFSKGPKCKDSPERVLLEQILKSVVENPEDVPMYLPKTGGILSAVPTPNTIIITSQALANAFLPLATWYTEIGHATTITTTEYIYSHYSGRDNAEKVRNYLLDVAQQLNITLWVILGGGDGVVPIRHASSRYDAIRQVPDIELDCIPTDWYYADLTGNWHVDPDNYWGEPVDDAADKWNENYVGRVPVQTTSEVQQWINKVIPYEQDPHNSSNLLIPFFQYAPSTGWSTFKQPQAAELIYGCAMGHDPYLLIDANADVTRQCLDDGYQFVNIYGVGDVDYYTPRATRNSNDTTYVFSYLTSSEDSKYAGLNYLENQLDHYTVYSLAQRNAGYDNLIKWPPSQLSMAEAFLFHYGNVGSLVFLGNTRSFSVYGPDFGPAHQVYMHQKFAENLFGEPYQGSG